MTVYQFPIALWEFPEGDFARWLELVKSQETRDKSRNEAAACATHRDYLTLLAAVQADHERSGGRVHRVRISVDEMHCHLRDHNWPNTPENRAALLSLCATGSIGCRTSEDTEPRP